MVPIIGQQSQIPGVPAHAIRKRGDGSIDIDIGAMNRGEKIDFIIAQWGRLEATVGRVDSAVAELVRLNYFAGAAVKLLADLAGATEDEVIAAVLEEASAARDEVRSRAEARKKGCAQLPPCATTIRLNEALGRWGRQPPPASDAAPGPKAAAALPEAAPPAVAPAEGPGAAEEPKAAPAARGALAAALTVAALAGPPPAP